MNRFGSTPLSSLARALLLAAAIALLAAPTVSAVGVVDRAPLSTDGARIVDRDGRPFVVQGVNWFGFETSDHIPHGLWTRDYREMLAQIRAVGFNAIRLPFSLQALRSTTPVGNLDRTDDHNAALVGRTPLEALDVIVDEAASQGLLVLLDFHSVMDNGVAYGLWYGPEGTTEEDWVATWQMLARRYGGRPNVVAADLKNEPHEPTTWGDGAPTDWRRAAERAGRAIQQIAPHWLILVEGIGGRVEGQQLSGHWWGGNLEAAGRHPVRLPRPHKLVYSPHEYGPGVNDAAWFHTGNLVETLYDRWEVGFDYLSRSRAAPILIGEFGGRLTDAQSIEGRWQRQLMDFVSRGRRSFAYWSWNPNSGDTGGVLMDDWRTVDPVKAALLGKVFRGHPVDFPGRPAIAPGGGPPLGGGAASLSARATLRSAGPGRACATIAVSNRADVALRPLRLTFTLDPRVAIERTRGGSSVRSGNAVTVRPRSVGLLKPKGLRRVVVCVARDGRGGDLRPRRLGVHETVAAARAEALRLAGSSTR